MKKIIMICLIITLGSFIYLTASHTSLETSAPATVLDLWVQDIPTADELYFSQALQRFEKTHPNIHIQLKILSGNDLKVAHSIETEFLNGNYPDLMILSLLNYNQFATEGYFYALDDYIATYDKDYFMENVITQGCYNNNLYGIAYALDPEILVYRKDFLNSMNMPYPEAFRNIEELESYLALINVHYSTDELTKTAFGIPTLIKNGHYLASFIGKDKHLEETQKILDSLSQMYKTFDTIPYHYEKTGIHPFWLGKAALAIEPLSSIYSAIEKDNNLLRKIGIVPINNSNLKFSYSAHKYISVLSKTNFPKEALTFLDFFFSTSEVLYRYQAMNLPIMIEPLVPSFLKSKKFNNNYIIDYVRSAFHYPIDPLMPNFITSLDNDYEQAINGLNPK